MVELPCKWVFYGGFDSTSDSNSNYDYDSDFYSNSDFDANSTSAML